MTGKKTPKQLAREAKRRARPARGKAGKVTVVDISGDGTGPWKLFVGEWGAAQFPSEAANDDPKSYAKEVARVIRCALKDRKHGPVLHKSDGESK